jgi:hypothetical protein
MVSIMFTCLQSQPLVVLGMLHPMAAAATVAVAALYSNQRTVAAFIAAHVHQRRLRRLGVAHCLGFAECFQKNIYGSF